MSFNVYRTIAKLIIKFGILKPKDVKKTAMKKYKEVFKIIKK